MKLFIIAAIIVVAFFVFILIFSLKGMVDAAIAENKKYQEALRGRDKTIEELRERLMKSQQRRKL